MISEVVINEFVAECREHLNAAERDLLAMEGDQGKIDPEIVNNLFRAIHSIKGASGTFGFNAVMDLSHAMENVLILFRNNKIKPDHEKVNALLKGVDKLRLMIDDLQGSDEVAYEGEIRSLNAIIQGRSASEENASRSAPIVSEVGMMERRSGMPPADAPGSDSENRPDSRPKHSGLVGGPEAADRGKTAASETIRVNVRALDTLVNLAGELVLGRNQLRQLLDRDLHEDPKVNTIIQNVDLVTTEIQEHIMQMRMQPVGNILSRLRRLVRDLAFQLSKDVEFFTEGEDVELDKSILEGLTDPLTHMQLYRSCH